jgi:sec-independent protein translocase protein TatC
MRSGNYEYSEDLFADTRMSFGEHIEELRTHLIRAIKGLIFCLLIGFVLDAVGYATGRPWIGIGYPAMKGITSTVQEQLKAYYERQVAKLELEGEKHQPDAERILQPRPMKMGFKPSDLANLAKLLGLPAPPQGSGEIEWMDVLVPPLDVYKAHTEILNTVRPPGLTTLSITETFVVYFKVSLLCGFIIASPWVFWQVWSFIAAGLYPHEKKLVHYYLPISLALFLAGVALCQFAVLPRSIEALLWFNEWLGVSPDLRLNEWLSFAIILPLVFGISFQTPLVMLFLERIGVMTAEGFASYWRVAVFGLAVFAAMITPTPDAVTWFCMWAPMMGLYVLGIYLCKLSARRRPVDFDVPETDELIEV